jgi:predicted MFS family arabinose efflux permease
MSFRGVVALGAAQCVNWGVLYYAFGALLLPMQRDLGTSAPVVAGAFSAALLISGLAAPAVGRYCDAGKGPLLLRIGALAAAVLLWLLAAVPHVATLYAVWTALGLCMAAVLYEPAFAVVGRSVADPRARLRALAVITVFGGLASTIVLPLTAYLLDRSGWRWTVVCLGVLMAASAAIPIAQRGPDAPAAAPSSLVAGRDRRRQPPGAPLRAMTAIFAFASFAGAAFTATAVTAFVDRGITPARAALFASLLGVMQLPGRLILMTGRLENPSTLAALSLALQAGGFLMLVIAPTSFIVAGVALFAVGNGVMTLVRPYLVHFTFEPGRTGARNGAIARAQQLARASGPLAATSMAAVIGYGATFAVFAVCLTGLATWCWHIFSAPARDIIEEVT